MANSKSIFWAVFLTFVGCALWFDGHVGLFAFGGPLGTAKRLIWAAWIGFLAYTVYCSSRENLFKTVGKMSELHWGRQIGIDLYLGLMLAVLVIYLNEGSALVALLWLLPGLLFVNLVTYLYFAIHFEEIVARFLG